MKALHANGFPVPEPLDVNRHCVVMRLADGYQLNSIQESLQVASRSAYSTRAVERV